MPDHRSSPWSGRGRSRGYRGRHSAGAALELDATELAEREPEPESDADYERPDYVLPGEPEPELEPVPDHVDGQPLGDTERVSLELHMAAAAAGDTDRSDGIWRV